MQTTLRSGQRGVSPYLSWVWKHRFWLIFLAAFAIRIAAIIVIDNSTEMLTHGFYSESGREFATLAHNIVAGEGFSLHRVQGVSVPSAYMPPAYVFFLVPFFYLFGEGLFTFILVQCVHAFLGGLSCIALYKLAETVFSRSVGIISALLMAFYPPLIYTVAEAHPISMYILLNILMVSALLRVSVKTRLRRIVLAGALAGILTLFRSEMVLLVPLMALWLFFNLSGTKGTNRMEKSFLFIVIAFSITAPWTIRNYLVFHKVVPVHSCSGYDFSRGHNPDATGTGMSYSGKPIEGASGIPGVLEAIESLPPTSDWEVKKDDIYLKAALGHIATHPWKTVKMTLIKFFYFWGIDITYPLARHPLYWASWIVAFSLAILGLIRAFKERIRASLFYLYFGFYTGIEMMFFVLPRHRMFIEPFVLVFSAYGLYYLWGIGKR